MKMTSRKLAFCALMTALTAIFSQIAIPFAPVPINLSLFAVFVAGGFLGALGGAFSQLVYILLGVVGIPVFAGFTSGIGALMGPTGGYIWGYVVASFLTGLIINKNKSSFIRCVIAMTVGLLSCYLLGTLWFMYVMNATLVTALMACVVPFLIGDVLKIFLATLVLKKLNKVFKV